MVDTNRLTSARRHLREGRIDDGIRELMELVGEGSAEAPDYLGILYFSGNGVPKDVEKAKSYFLMSHTRGYALGTYHLAGEYKRESNFKGALELLKLIADKNPSAAYWAFRCLVNLSKENKKLEAESEKYLIHAANLGHIEALRTIPIRTIKGRYGLKNIPRGIFKYFRSVRAGLESIEKRERFKYIDSLHRMGFRQLNERIRQQKR
jgi:TPR repeat protein